MSTNEGSVVMNDSPGAGQTAMRRVILCAGTGCMANGAMKVFERFRKEMDQAGLNVVLELRPEAGDRDVRLSKSGCQGFCQMGPLVSIVPDGILYTKVRAEDVPEIVERTLVSGEAVERLLYKDPATRRICRGLEDNPFYARQDRRVLRECGFLDPEDIREFMLHGGYSAAKKAFLEMSPENICKQISESGLRGRGGGGFPTGRKWEAARIQKAAKKYVICNGDEGDPGAFMNRSVMEGNPHSVIEGLMIAARAIGADQTFVYVRAEYPLAVERMNRAVADAEREGILGKNVFGTGLTLKCNVLEGAGAFVCGEETAMIASIEGRRGMPTPKPPFPAQSGLWGKPTIINNVETLAHVPRIINEGAAAFRSIGTPESPGTKTFALTGHVANTGLVEVPFGTKLRELVLEISGGITDDNGKPMKNGFKAVQIGGPSGGCLTEEHLDLPLAYDSLRKVGAMVGSGGLVVLNQRTCMVSMARFFMEFTQRESCGKCVLCREGTKQLLALLDDVIEGRADAGTLDLLEKLGRAVQVGSLCGLGKTAPNPVLSTLRYFRKEYEEHIFEKRCRTGRCKALLKPEINAERCKGCGLCIKSCPTGAISGEKKKPHHIDPELCIKCGACATACKLQAVEGV
ncbi:MAG: NADH-ubiquinone oxidoreductase-F iron-sulfur binding region domain-containing protein [Terracidiphilus sp.]|nr:NADH-ubiquinone oxidoreductase-F iron-sulfur binding region domain-containing protein [Terracidiphilus sp.]MDR3799066.1 NADH-ubiquinone oxidoreductase-F iron-sulfur binding region domain-containing protein [Terracidiphilus sp.]